MVKLAGTLYGFTKLGIATLPGTVTPVERAGPPVACFVSSSGNASDTLSRDQDDEVEPHAPGEVSNNRSDLTEQSDAPREARGLEEEIPDPALRVQPAEDLTVVLDAPQARDGAEQVIARDVALRRAGTQGDIVGAARTLPGVGRTSPNSGELSLWGALPQQSRRYIDNVPVPRLFHWGMPRSVVPASQISSLRIEPVAFSAAYGQAIGGMASVELIAPRSSGDRTVHSQMDVSPLEGALALSHAPSSRWAWTAALRHSLQKQTMRSVLPRDRRDLYPLADNLDYQVQLAHRLDEDTKLTFKAFGAWSRQRIARASDEVARAFVDEREDDFHRLALSYVRSKSAGSTRALLWVGLQGRTSDMSWQLGRLQAGRSRRSTLGGLRYQTQTWLIDRLRLDAGLDLEWSVGRYGQRGSLTLPPREGDARVWGQAPGPEYAQDNWQLARVFVAPFASLTTFLGSTLSLTTGLRLATSAGAGDRRWPTRPTEPATGYLAKDVGWSPRLALKWTRSRWDHWSLRAGLHRQLAAPEDLSPRFGNPHLGAQKAYQAALVLNLFLGSKLRTDWTVFWNNQTDLVTRNVEPNPELAENLLHLGLGRNYGAQTQIQYDPTNKISAVAHYSFTVAQKKDHPQALFRSTDLEQRHQAQAMLSWRVGTRWTLSGRAQWSQGFPRTPVIGALPVNVGTSYAPIFGAINRDRLPSFFSGSARVAYEQTWGARSPTMLRVWLDVQNISNHPNVEEFAFSYDYRIRYGMPGLPIFPTLGVTVTR